MGVVLILSSDALPPGLPDGTWLFDPTPTVVAVTPLEGRALLARKRRFTPNGARITLGNRLLDPWQKVLDANGITVSCLTSRTLNRVAEVVEASASLAGVTMKPMAPTPDRAAVVVGTFDPALVFPLTDPMTVPLLRLMLATDDVRHASMLFVMADHQERETTGTQRAIHGGQMWYGFRLLCSHLRESGNALTTLVNSVADRRLQDLLDGRPDATAALERLRVAFGPDAFITKVRDSIGSHYQQADIKRVYERDLEAGRVDGSLIACQVGGLSRFTITDVLALRLMDEAAGEDLATGGEEFAKRGEGVVALAADLSTFVGHLVDALLNQQGFQVTHDTIEVPALLRAAYDAYDALEKARQA